MPLQVQDNDKTKLEVHGIATRLGERCTAVPLQVRGTDKTKLQVHSSVRAQLRVKNSYKIKQEVHTSATAGTKQ